MSAKSVTVLVLIALVVTLTPSAQSQQQAPPDKELIAVLDLDSEGATKEQGSAFSARLREELLKGGRFRMVDRSQLDQVLKEQALQQSGCTTEECAVQVGRILGVRKIVSGRLIKVSEGVWQVSAQMLDVETAETLKAESVLMEGAFIGLLRGGAGELAGKLAGVTAPTAPSQQSQQAVVRTPEPPTPKAGDVWREPTTGMELVYVPGGEFEQGCGSWTSECSRNEKPTRRVRLSPFWLGKTEVTQGQWKRVTGNNPSKFQKGDDFPVEQVSWNDVQDFIKKLNAQSAGVTFRLPSEAEWEYACRVGGKPLKYGTQTGDLNPSLAKYGSQDGTVRVGSFAPNGLGLHDVSGNLWEWTQDEYIREAYQSGAASDPLYQRSNARHVFRGGSWANDPRFLRCSNRDDRAPSVSNPDLGFRLARTS